MKDTQQVTNNTMPEQDTQTNAPEADDVAASGNVEETAQSESASTNESQEGVEQSTTKSGSSDSSKDTKYLGKKYKDINAFESAHHELLEKFNVTGREKNEMAPYKEAIAKLAIKSGMSEAQVLEYLESATAENTQQTSTGSQGDADLQNQLKETRLAVARMEERNELNALFEKKPHLKDFESEIRSSWIVSNKPLGEVAERFESIVSKGRTENKEDMLRKSKEQVETGKGSGEAPRKTSDMEREEALAKLKSGTNPSDEDIEALL